MLEVVLIFVLALVPFFLGFFLVRKAKRRWQARLRRIRSVASFRARSTMPHAASGDTFDIHDYFIGNLSCRYNARSPYIRCAINPNGPCENCPHYQPRQS
ncbi:hypothetical protein IQ249_02895 [Lusitaniella coriacea LEGE 07157]|uniref:Uncharacterized protein n=1 Tax=Lusitaniella coriacea LEGE 07157 TaxID=945747 RepID=A0A8J7ARL8_9CYAN|nr:DUF6464 family protein [Lusitaniella coriacea]MBE9114836.1 hypothetical protein [Lusitaniella coriacea LEGE 07157]